MNKTTFCKLLGVKLANIQWAWGGLRPDGSIVLLVWADEISKQRCIVEPTKDDPSPGGPDRRNHLNLIEAGAECFLAIAIDDGSGRHQSIGKLRTDYLFKGEGIERDDNGDRWIILGERIPFQKLRVQSRP